MIYFEMQCPKKKRYKVKWRFVILLAALIWIIAFLLNGVIHGALMSSMTRIVGWANYWL